MRLLHNLLISYSSAHQLKSNNRKYLTQKGSPWAAFFVVGLFGAGGLTSYSPHDEPQQQDHQEHADDARPGAGFEDGADGITAARGEGQDNEKQGG
jgi:hypothetical protein